MKKVIVISPHPDDETLGAGGTLLKLRNAGHKIYWFNFTHYTNEYGYTNEMILKRNKELADVTSGYGFEAAINFELRPAGLDTYSRSDLVNRISDAFGDIGPDTVILPYEHDIHSDHRVVFETVCSCTKVFRYPSIKEVLMMEILSETDFASPTKTFSPNYFVDISDYMESKLDILSIYKDELGAHPFPRNGETVKALSLLRGSQAGCRYAEAFMVIKIID